MRAMMLLCLTVAAAACLAGCATPAMVEFTAPRIMMHVEGEITTVERIHGEPKIERIDARLYRVNGTGEVRINEFHLVEVTGEKIRVHGVDVASRGAMRNVFVEKDKVIDCVHPDKVNK